MNHENIALLKLLFTSGIIAQINHELLSLGKAPLGFLNPWLYSNPSAFTDITSGSNPYQKCAGFQATTGWDPGKLCVSCY